MCAVGTWTFYLGTIFVVKTVISYLMNPEDVWTTTHVMHGMVSAHETDVTNKIFVIVWLHYRLVS